MKEYFSHDYNSRSDIKIKRLIMKHGMLGYGVFWAIIEDLYCNANALQSDCELIAHELRVDLSVVQSIMHDFDLFTFEGDIFRSESVERRLFMREDKSSKASNAANIRWEKEREKRNANAMRTHSESNAIKEKKRKEKERKDDINIISCNDQQRELLEWSRPFFAEKYMDDKVVDVFDKLVRLDGYQPEDIKKAIQWARGDDFWSVNFLSPLKLRNKDKNGVKYIDVFLAKLLKNGTNRSSSKEGTSWDELAAIVQKHTGGKF